MKILILANNDVGLYKFRKELIEKLLKKNEVYVSLPDGDFIKPLIDLGCKYIDTSLERRGTNVFKDYRLYKQYKRILKSISPDLVISYTIKPNIYGGLACKKAGIKFVANITGLGSSFQHNGLLKHLIVFLYKKALKKAHTVFFENSENMSIFIKEKIIKTSQAFLLNGAGVNLSDYKVLSFPTNDNATNFLFIGRVMKEKGIDDLLLASEKLLSDQYSFNLHIVGEFEEDKYKNQFDRYIKEGWLFYHGFQKNVTPFIEQCHCFVLPSWHEGMANTILESAASGRPVIATNIPGCRESVVDGKTGFLCNARDHNDLYNSMVKIIVMDTKERKTMGLLGRKYMEDKFDKNKIVDLTISRISIND